MILHIHSNASYLSEKKTRSRAAGHSYLASNSTKSAHNDPIHTLCSIMCNVMASAGEAEIGTVFHSAQDVIPLRNALEDMGHPQPPIPIQTDNTTAAGFLNNTIKQKRTKGSKTESSKISFVSYGLLDLLIWQTTLVNTIQRLTIVTGEEQFFTL